MIANSGMPSGELSVSKNQQRGLKKQVIRSILLVEAVKDGPKLIRKRIKDTQISRYPVHPRSYSADHRAQASQSTAIRFRKGLVGILDASPGDITALYASVGLEIEAEPDMPDVEFFGLKREPDGIRQITCYAPAQVYLLSEERAHINADGSVKISEVEIGTERIYPSKSWSKARALALIEQIGEIHHNILLPDMCRGRRE